MIKSELVARVAAENPHLSERDIERVVNAILARISDALINGDRVELRGFGSFTVMERGARTGRNPKTGAAVAVETKRLPQFRLGRSIRDLLNPSGIINLVRVGHCSIRSGS